MALITFDGHIGAGAPEVGRRIARMFDLDYIDRLILPGSARVQQARVESHSRNRRFSDRFWSTMERIVSGFALGNMAGDPYFATPDMFALPLTWDESPDAPKAPISDPKGSAGDLRERAPMEQIIENDRAVLVHRAGAVELKDAGALRVGLFANWGDRVKRVMEREGLVRTIDAERLITDRERAQHSYFKEIHGAAPTDSSLYDTCIDTSRVAVGVATLEVARLVRRRLALAAS